MRVLSRIAHTLLSLLALTLIVFVMVRITGDPLQLLLPENATREDFERYREYLGLDQPLPIQYAIYMGQLVQGDLGQSVRLHVPVATLIGQRFPATLLLGVTTFALVVLVGVPLGVYAAYARGRSFDRIVRAVAALGQAAPAFWVGLLLILLFAVQLKVLPAGGSGTPLHLVLPAVTVAFGALAGLARLVRSSMIEILNTDYVKFLRIKGVPERSVLWKHALRNAGLTALTFMGVVTAGLITGSVVAETVFTWPGLGSLMMEAIAGRDFPVIQGVVLMYSAIYIGVNFLVDMLYVALNPRLR